jgi:hypothetical protein
MKLEFLLDISVNKQADKLLFLLTSQNEAFFVIMPPILSCNNNNKFQQKLIADNSLI